MESRTFLECLVGLDVPEPPSDPEEAGRLIRWYGLEGLAVSRHRAEGPFLSSELSAELEPAYHVRGLATTLILESAHRAISALDSSGLSPVLFKGAALVGSGIYADAGARRMDDADLVVPFVEGPAAVAALIAAGFRPLREWSPSTTGWSDALTLHDTSGPAGSPCAIDLHWSTAYDRLRFGGGTDSILVERPTGHRAEPEAHLVVTAEHLLKHLRFRVHLAAYADLARLATAVGDWDRVGDLVGRSRFERGIRAVLEVTRTRLGASVPAHVLGPGVGSLADTLAPSTLVKRSALGAGGRLAGIAHRWRLLGRPSHIARDVKDAAFPPDAWLNARYGRGGPMAWMQYVTDVLKWATYRGRSPASPNQHLFEARARD